MHKTKVFYPVFVSLFFLALLFVFVSSQGWLVALPGVNAMFAPMQRLLFTHVQPSTSDAQLQQENRDLQQQLLQFKELQADNAALRDQFQTIAIPAKHLLPAHVVGAPGLLSGSVTYVVLDKGTRDGVQKDMVVVYKDMLVGKIVAVTAGFSQMDVVSNIDISFSAKTINTKALGVIKGQGDGMVVLDNVILDQTLRKGDLVVTSGDMDMHGKGYPPNLIVGKIASIQKDPSALFQKATITSLVDVTKLSVVFIKLY